MTEVLPRYDPRLLPVPYGGAAPRPEVPLVPADQRRDAIRAEPPPSEVRYARSSGTDRAPSDGRTAFAAQQLAHEHRLQLARAKPLIAGYAAYAATAQQTDPDRPRPGQTLDRSV